MLLHFPQEKMFCVSFRGVDGSLEVEEGSLIYQDPGLPSTKNGASAQRSNPNPSVLITEAGRRKEVVFLCACARGKADFQGRDPRYVGRYVEYVL